MSGEEELSDGFNCSTCGTYQKYSAYVFAHWDIELIHTCECNAKHRIKRGLAQQIESGQWELAHQK